MSSAAATPPRSPKSEQSSLFEVSVGEAFERQVEGSARRIAVAGPSRAITYEELNARANRLARAIVDRGTGESSPVALLMQPGESAIAGLIAAFKAGTPALSLDLSYPQETLAYLLHDAGAGVLVADTPNLSLARELAAEASTDLVHVDAIASSIPGSNLGRRVDPRSPSMLLYTSGSTGRPKGVFQVHRNHIRSARRHVQVDSVAARDRFMLLSSIAFGAANGVVFPALLNGASIHCFDLKNGFGALANWIAAERITIYQSVPAVFRRLVDSLPAGSAFPGVRMVRLGGDSIFREDFERYCRWFSDECVFSASLASTEAGTITQFLADKNTRLDGPLVPVGSPVAGVEIRIIDEDGGDLAPGEIGEIEVASPYLAGGYWRNPDLTAERFRPHPRGGDWRVFRTGDLGRQRPDGLLEHRGRVDDRIKVRGYRVEPAAVEAELRALPGITDVAVVAAEAFVPGEKRLVAYVVPESAAPSFSREIKRALAARVPPAMVPESIVMLDALPLTPRGKLDRHALPSPEPEDDGSADAFGPPRDEVEQMLLEIWRKILPGRVDGIDANFFDIGGDSLLAVEMLAGIERRLGRWLPLPILLDAPTIELLARVLRAPTPDVVASSAVVALRATGTRIPFFCVPGGNGPGFNFRTLARLLGEDQPFYAFHVATEIGQAVPATMTEWARNFLGALRAIQPHGPYRLGGHSFGGHVAYEMARLLHEEGEIVEFVALLDTYAPGYPVRGSALQQTAGRWLSFLRRPWKMKVEAVRRRIRRVRRPKELGGAIRQYAHRPFAVPLVLFRALERDHRLGLSFDDPDNGWRAIAGDRLQTHSVGGSHDTLIEGAGAEEMARRLSFYLSKSMTEISETATTGPNGGRDDAPVPSAS